MKPSQAELLLRMAENTYADNDDRLAKARQVLTEGAREILADEEFLSKAWEINQRDKARFAQYLPQQNRSELAQGQQKTAALPLRKTAE
jgi:hypothetical protein